MDVGTPLDRLMSANYLDGIDRLGVAELRRRRQECQEVETGLSYFRRLIQGRLDIIQAELGRRRGGGSDQGLEDLIGQLPTILAEHSSSAPARGALPEVIAPPGVEEFSARLSAVVDAERLASLPSLDETAVQDMLTRLAEFERTVSSQRRALHERIDALQSEIIRRYKSGEATVDALLR